MLDFSGLRDGWVAALAKKDAWQARIHLTHISQSKEIVITFSTLLLGFCIGQIRKFYSRMAGYLTK